MTADLPAGPPPDAPAGIPVPPGLQLRPFAALRPAADGEALAARTSPPYDVLDDDDVQVLLDADPHNVVRLTLPRDRPGEPGSRYAVAAAQLTRWGREGQLVRDGQPGLYVYEQTEATGHVQRGLLGGVGLAEPDAGIILPHESTMTGPVADRLALLTATEADLEPIFLVYDGGGAASSAVAAAAVRRPDVEAVTTDGTRHRLWLLTDAGTLAAIAADLLPRRAVIADGHHRYATYLQNQARQHAKGRGTGPWDAGLALLVDATASGPQVHAIHRVLAGLPLAEAVARAGAGMRSRPLPGPFAHTTGGSELLRALAEARAQGLAFVVSDGTQAHLLTEPVAARLAAALPTDRSVSWRQLDVTAAHRYLIGDLWGLPDTEDVVGFAHDADAALAAARAAGGTALLLAPTPVRAVLDVAAAGERMPRKSTLFTPKPQTGLVLRPHAAAPA